MASTQPIPPKKDISPKGTDPVSEKRTPLVLVTKPGKKVEISYSLMQ